MKRRSMCPDYSTLDIPMDVWSQPFWAAGEKEQLLMPQCVQCGTFRWPAGPFCPSCHTQPVNWVAPGRATLYTFTVLPVRSETDGDQPLWRVPALVEFSQAPGVRLVSALIDAEIDDVAIGKSIEVEWHQAANTKVPVFRLSGE